ncbi:MAG: hypothetical protein OEV18_14425, partial [Deltaproteobacteria bacterium]|nr:hypothetical protein [Deltaproteobacteria bacterium]
MLKKTSRAGYWKSLNQCHSEPFDRLRTGSAKDLEILRRLPLLRMTYSHTFSAACKAYEVRQGEGENQKAQNCSADLRGRNEPPGHDLPN